MKLTRASFAHPVVRPFIASARAYHHAAKMTAIIAPNSSLSRYFRGQMRLDARTAVLVARFQP